MVPLKKLLARRTERSITEQIAIAKGEDPSDSNGSGTSTGGNQNQGGTTPTNPDNPGGDGTTDQN